MSTKEIYRDDLLNRYGGHTFTETITGDITKVEFKDGASAIIMKSSKMDAKDAYKVIRDVLVGSDVMLCLTTVQISALTGVIKGTAIYDETLENTCIHDGAAFK